MKTLTKILVLAGFAVIGAAQANADEYGYYNQDPRRAEVNQRSNNQVQQIEHEARHGEISPGEARALLNREQQIRHEEHVMAEHHDGHITPEEQARLNRQENSVSRELNR